MFMGWIAVYVTGLGGSKSGRRAQGPEAGSRRLTAAFFCFPEARLGGVLLGSPAMTVEVCSHRSTSGAHHLQIATMCQDGHWYHDKPCECYTVGSPYPRECGRCGSRPPRSVKPFPALPLPAVSEAMLDKSCSKASTMLPLKLIGPEALMFPGSP